MPDFVDVPVQWWDARDHSEEEALSVESDEALDENLFDDKIILKNGYWA